MNALDLRRAFVDLLAEIRSAGRGASRVALGELIDQRLPALVLAADAHVGERVADDSRERIRQAAVAAGEDRLRRGSGTPAWPRGNSSRRLVWGLGLAAATAIVVVAVLLMNSVIRTEPLIVQPGPTRGGPSPIPKVPSPRPEGPVVEKGPKVDVKLAPAPGPERAGSKVASKAPKAGAFGAVMGEPLVFAPGAKKGVAAVPGMVVAMGSRIETGDVDKAELKFSDGSLLRLGFNTRIAIPMMASGHQPIVGTPPPLDARPRPDLVVLQGGTLFAEVTPREGRAKFQVETPAATAEVLGTAFELKLERLAQKQGDDEYKATLQVLSGQVRFYNAAGERTASEGMESWATEGSRPTEPKRIEVLSTLRLAFGHSWAITSSLLDATEGGKRFATAIGYLGPDAATLEPGRVKIVWPRNGSQAQLAGVRAGDILLSFDDRPIESAEQLVVATYLSPRKRVRLGIEREGRRFEIVAQIGVYNENLPAVPASLRDALQQATEFAIRGETEEALQRFRDMATRTPHPAGFNGLGVVHEMRDEMGPAIRAYRRAVEGSPSDALYHLNLGLALQKIGNFERSLEELLEAHMLQPGWLKTAQAAASAYEILGRHVEAIALLEQDLRSRPEDGTLLISKARHLLALHRSGEAKSIVQEILQRDPGFYFAWSTLAEIYHDERDLDATARAYRSFLAAHPSDAGQWFSYGLVLYESRQNAEAESAFRRALSLDPKHQGAVIYSSKSLQAEGRLQEAVGVLRDAIRRSPRHGAFHVELGAAFANMGRHPEAEAAFQRAIDLGSDSASGYSNLSILRTRQGRFEEAAELARRAVELLPNNHRARNILGLQLQGLGRNTEAEAEFLKAIELGQGDCVPLFNLGRLKHFSGNLDEGEKWYRKALAVEPREPEIWNNLGSLVKSRGDLKQAEELWRRAVEVGPRHALAHTNLADLLLASSRASEALELARKAVKLNSGDARAWMILGWAAKESGQAQEAEPAFRKAAALAPSDLRVQDSLLLFLLLQGNGSDEVVALAVKTRALAPEDQTIGLHLGWAYGLAKNFQQAEPLLVSGLAGTGKDKDPFFAPAWAILAEVYENTGRKDKAIETYKIALSLDPKEPKALDGLKRLGG